MSAFVVYGCTAIERKSQEELFVGDDRFQQAQDAYIDRFAAFEAL